MLSRSYVCVNGGVFYVTPVFALGALRIESAVKVGDAFLRIMRAGEFLVSLLLLQVAVLPVNLGGCG